MRSNVTLHAWLDVDVLDQSTAKRQARIDRCRYHFQVGVCWGKAEISRSLSDAVFPEMELADYPPEIVEPPCPNKLLEAGRVWGRSLAVMGCYGQK